MVVMQATIDEMNQLLVTNEGIFKTWTHLAQELPVNQIPAETTYRH